jgi:Uma2 family endonuclease
MQNLAIKYISPEEYLAMEETAAYKSEYYQGEIFAMAGASFNHIQIVSNVGSDLSRALRNTNCRAMMNELRVWVKTKDLFVYPDVTVVCGKPVFYENRNDTITNPLVIVEVLSDSTKNYDRGEKFEFYRAIPTFQEYILIDQHRVHVEHFFIDAEKKWGLLEFNKLSDVLKLTKIDFQISLQDIYHRIEFENQ